MGTSWAHQNLVNRLQVCLMQVEQEVVWIKALKLKFFFLAIYDTDTHLIVNTLGKLCKTSWSIWSKPHLNSELMVFGSLDPQKPMAITTHRPPVDASQESLDNVHWIHCDLWCRGLGPAWLNLIALTQTVTTNLATRRTMCMYIIYILILIYQD